MPPYAEFRIATVLGATLPFAVVRRRGAVVTRSGGAIVDRHSLAVLRRSGGAAVDRHSLAVLRRSGGAAVDRHRLAVLDRAADAVALVDLRIALDAHAHVTALRQGCPREGHHQRHHRRHRNQEDSAPSGHMTAASSPSQRAGLGEAPPRVDQRNHASKHEVLGASSRWPIFVSYVCYFWRRT